MADQLIETSESDDLALRDAEGDRFARKNRLEILEQAKGMNSTQQWIFQLLKTMVGQMPNPALVLSYHRRLFGKWFSHFAQRSMRQSDHWKLEELELFAAFTANRLNCDY